MGKALVLKYGDEVYNASLYIVSHPVTFNDNFVSNTKERFDKIRFTQKHKLDELEGGVCSFAESRNNNDDDDVSYFNYYFLNSTKYHDYTFTSYYES